MFTFEFDYFDWLSQFYSQGRKTPKLVHFLCFLLRSGYTILVKIWQWLKLLNSVPFIKKTLVNHLCIGIRSSWLTFTVLQRMKKDFKISQFKGFLLRSEYAIQVKIRKWLKLLNSVPFIKKKTWKSCLHSNLIILTDFHSFTENEEKSKISQFLKFSSKVRVCDLGQNFTMTETS